VSSLNYVRHDELLGRVHVGPVDQLSAEQILALLPTHSAWPDGIRFGNIRTRGAGIVLAWLSAHPGQGWQERWRNADGDDGLGWITGFTAANPRAHGVKRAEVTSGLRSLMLSRVVLPGYVFFSHAKPGTLFAEVVDSDGGAAFPAIEKAAQALGLNQDQYLDARAVLAKMVLHTGRIFTDLVVEDLYEYRASFLLRGNRSAPGGLHAAWDLLREIGVLPAGSTLRERLRRGQKSPAELVDRHRIQCRPIRDLLVRYLSERRTSIDYSTLRSLASSLVGTFWADIERHHQGIDSLHLPLDVAQAWKERLATVSTSDGQSRDRQSCFDVMGQVRSFYLDMQEWAVEDPSWVPWAVPCPVRRGDTDGMSKKKLKASARIHQRIRERLPLLPDLVAAIEGHHADATALLDVAATVALDAVFEHNGVSYRRIRSAAGLKAGPDGVVVANMASKQRVDLSRAEDDAFWVWAIVETLRHSGIRVEELMELTHLALVSYTLPGSGEVVPLLQIVPSKSNEERLLLVSPELASVLAAIVTRLRRRNGGAVPLVARYDDYEAVTGPALPHLFQRRFGPQPSVMSVGLVRNLLNRTLARTDLRDLAGQPLRYTPHDFRRMFATEAVGNGLPVHIAAKLLGHRNITTTQAYIAIFQDDLIRTYRRFLDERRAMRPAAEYREPTDEEWSEFQQHFELRKVSLGTCARPYGTPCRHEHACIRCPVLRVDPQQRHRLLEIARNLNDRIIEARQNGWLGEVQGLQISLKAAQDKLAALDRASRLNNDHATYLGIPGARPE
jgi:integrase